MLDGEYRLLPEVREWNEEFRWYKNTIAVFRATDYIKYLEDFGYEVSPFLVVRDVREVWASLTEKGFGRNGTTAEDPPLRLRFRRFLRDWRHFRNEGLPIVRWEDFLRDPETFLRELCVKIELTWSPDLIRWPKSPEDILHTKFGSATFWDRLDEDLRSSLDRDLSDQSLAGVYEGDLLWLDWTFDEFNAEMRYDAHRGSAAAESAPEGWDPPSFQAARMERRPGNYVEDSWSLHWLKRMLGFPVG